MSAAPNGHSALAWILRALGASAALLGLVYFGLRVGTSEQRLTGVEARVTEEVGRSMMARQEMRVEVDQKLAQQRELILAELRAIGQRLDRIERAVR